MLATPTIDPSAFIGPNVTVWGEVTIAADVVLLPGVVIRAEYESITIGARTNIQDNSVVHVHSGFGVRIGAEVTVGHMAMLHGCTVEDNVLIGMSATVLNGAVVGAGAMVAAGSLVPPGMVIPPGMLAIGSPAKIRRPVTDAEIAETRRGLELYQEFAARYRAAGLGRG